MSGMFRNSSFVSDSEKDHDHSSKEPELTEAQEELHEAYSIVPFTAQDDHHATSANLEKVASAKPSVNSIRAVPNGGVVAWLQVLGVFFLFCNTWGIVNTFGTYQTYYEVGILSHKSPSDISWVGALQGCLLMIVGPLTGPIYDAGYVHHLLIIGSILAVLGQMTLSLCTEYWQVVLAQAVCIGVGSGCLFVPGIALLSTYFSTRPATAVGIAASGSSLGGIMYPIVFHRLQPMIGFAGATRVLGFLMLGTLLVSNCVLRLRVLPQGRRKILDLAAFKEPPYLFFVLGTSLGFMGVYTPFFHVQSYAIETGIMDANLGFYLLAILNGVGTFGRLIPNFLADKVGVFNVMVPCTFATALLCLCYIPSRSTASVIVLTALYGFCSGTFVSLPSAIFVHVSSHARHMTGTRMGMGFAVTSIGLLIGTPICGAILTASSFTYVWVFGGIMTVLSGCSFIVARGCQGGWSPTAKV